MSVGTVATTSTRALLLACEHLGVDTAALLRDVGLPDAAVHAPEGRLPADAVALLWQRALQKSGDRDIGLRAALAVPFGSYRVIDFLAASAPTVGEGLTRVARYFPLINSVLRWDVADGSNEVRMALTHVDPARDLPRPYAEYALTVTVRHCRAANGFDWPLREVCLAFPAPDSAAAHEAALGCPVRFAQPRHELVIDRATWDLPSRAASSELLRTLEQHADRLIASLQIDTQVQAQVARWLAEELRGGDPTLARIARRMAMSERTLQRKLSGEGTSFADVLDRTRRSCAEVYVRAPELPLTEVAYLLGFSEPSAFSRAFQRWYGVPPSHYRERVTAA